MVNNFVFGILSNQISPTINFIEFTKRVHFSQIFILNRNYNSRSRNITFSSLDNESETETDPVYYEAESLYATPVGNTASDHSKSINENEVSIYEMSQTIQLMNQIKTPDMSKATSEPIQIYLDCLINESVQSLHAHGKSTDGQTVAKHSHTEQKYFNIGKSFSDNTLSTECTNPSNGTETNGQQSQLSNHIKSAKSNISNQSNQMEKPKLADREDETSNCDASELLTPVNERNISDRYLLESDTSDSLAHGHCDLNDAININDLNIETSNEANEMDKPHLNAGHSKSAPPLKTTSRRFSKQTLFPDGKYKGKAVHCDGNVFNIFYTISSQELPCGRKVFCVWICRDECDIDDEEDDGKHPNLTLTFNSITSNIETSVDGVTGTAKRNSMNVNANQSSRPNSVSLLSQYEDDQVSGEYNKYYTSLKQIGKGAFGYVKLSFRHSDRLLVVTKFILKDKLPPQFMVITEDKKEIPMEVYLLSTLKHPNIVTVIDVFENEKFFQLVMEKHGSGMDLFEFIDRRPLMDEQLGKYLNIQ